MWHGIHVMMVLMLEMTDLLLFNLIFYYLFLLRFIQASTAETQIFVCATLTNMSASWLAMFRTSSHCFFSVLKGY